MFSSDVDLTAPPSPDPPPRLHDREEEWQWLLDRWRTDAFELAILIGRRRVGKTSLLKPFAEMAGGIYYQATRRTEAEQLRSISRIAAERFDDSALRHGAGFSDWEALFAYLADRAGDRRFVVVLDEYPYLESAARGVSTVLQKIVDHRLLDTRFKVVLSGSHITAMKQMESSAHPLYQRRTARLVLAPFTYRDAARFYPTYDPRRRLEAYGVFGGVPGHLSLFDPKRSLAWNACRQMLDPNGRLYDEAEHMLDAFLSEAGVHYSILEAIAAGEGTWSGITKRTGKPGGTISRPLDWLRDMGFVRREVPVTSANPKKSRRSLYRIVDPYLRFWYRHVSPLIEAGLVGHAPPRTIWDAEIAQRLPDYMGPVFEEACRTWVRGGPPEVPFTPVRVGRWWDRSSDHEIDVVALSGDGEVWVAECKWGPVSPRDLALLKEHAGRLSEEVGTVRRLHFALISGRLERDPELEPLLETEDVAYYTAADLY